MLPTLRRRETNASFTKMPGFQTILPASVHTYR